MMGWLHDQASSLNDQPTTNAIIHDSIHPLYR